MATKTLTITEEAYNALNLKKESEESFSKVILRLSGKKRLSDFFGSISEESADIIDNRIKEERIMHRERHSGRLSR